VKMMERIEMTKRERYGTNNDPKEMACLEVGVYCILPINILACKL